jgi:replicative DNA helicase
VSYGEQLRVLPQAIEAEQAVLGGLMLDPNALAKVADRLTETSFYRADHRAIWRAITELEAAGQPYDVVTLAQWFESHDRAREVRNSAYLVDLVSGTPSAANIGAYADVVRDKAILRAAIDTGTALVNAAFQPGGRAVADVLDAAIRDLMTLTKADANCEFTLKQAVTLAWQDAGEAHAHKGELRGITTGFSRMDKRLGGWHPGDLVMLGARPSMGKTALMVNMALSAAAAGHSVGVISGEQSAMQIGQRSISSQSGVHAERLRNGDIDEDAWPKLTDAMRRLVERKMRIYDRSAPTLDEIARIARRWKQEHGMAVLFVDYLQRIRFPKADSRIDEVSEVARGLKTLARDLEIPVVCLAQVKAVVDTRNDKRPTLGDIANSDEATREADMIGFLYRGEVYAPDDAALAGLAELNIEKYRHGPTGRFKLHFSGETMLFRDLEDRPDF